MNNSNDCRSESGSSVAVGNAGECIVVCGGCCDSSIDDGGGVEDGLTL